MYNLKLSSVLVLVIASNIFDISRYKKTLGIQLNIESFFI